MTVKTLSGITAIILQLGTNQVKQLAKTTLNLSNVVMFRLGTLTVRQLAVTTTLSSFCYSIPTGNKQGQVTGHNHSISVLRFTLRLDTLTVRQLAMTVTTLSRITAILFQLETNKVKQVAITTATLSSVTRYYCSTRPAHDHAPNSKYCYSVQ